MMKLKSSVKQLATSEEGRRKDQAEDKIYQNWTINLSNGTSQMKDL